MIRQFACAAVFSVATAQFALADEVELPPEPAWQTDAQSCAWHWREGGGIGLWAETCTFSTGEWQVVWDENQAAFVTLNNGVALGIAVQPWAVAHGSDISSLTQKLREAGHLAIAADCEWQAVALRAAPRTMAFHVLTPKDPAALQPSALSEVPEPMCGPYGASTHGVRYFVTDLRWPDRVVFVDEGQERPMFEPASITLMP